MKVLAALLGAILLLGCSQSGAPLLGNDTEQSALDDSGYVFDDETDAPPPDAEKQNLDTDEEDNPGTRGDPAPQPLAPLRDASEEVSTEEAASGETETAEPEKPDLNAKARKACERNRGTLSKTTKGFFLCVKNTGEGQKSCKSAKDCKGACLARSGTCSPLDPLIGCYDILTEKGTRATVCVD